jgi:hypothetical protein
VSTQSPFGTNGTDEERANDPGRGVRGETGPMAYIRRRIAEIINRSRPP